MNDARRKEIRRALDLLDQARTILEDCANEETEYLDNMPDAFKEGEKGDRAGEVISALEDAASSIEDIDLEDALS